MQVVKTGELSCTQVRWFYRRKHVAELWKPINGYYSIRLEFFWRTKNGFHLDSKTNEIFRKEKINEKSAVFLLHGILYRATEDFSSAHCIFSKDHEIEITRGVWFEAESMQPLDNDLAESIEEYHLKLLRSQASPDTFPGSENILNNEPGSASTKLILDDGSEVLWNSLDDVTLYKNTIFYWLLRLLTCKGTALRRGYDEAHYEDGKNDISTLIFVVHGVGYKDGENLLAENTEKFRRTIYAFMDTYNCKENSKPVILPIRWQYNSDLDDELENITVSSKKLVSREDNSMSLDPLEYASAKHGIQYSNLDLDVALENSCKHDIVTSTVTNVMLYQSPEYQTKSQKRLVEKLNSTYEVFMEGNPHFSGEISLYAHSFGSVLCYDILTGHTLLERSKTDAIGPNRHSPMRVDKGTSNELELKFEVTNLFCIGSPLPAILKSRSEKALDLSQTKAKRIYNIFYPDDPIAYRLEPVFHKRYRFISPITLFASTDPKCLSDYDSIAPQINYLGVEKLDGSIQMQDELKCNKVNPPAVRSDSSPDTTASTLLLEKERSLEIRKEIEDAKHLNAEEFINKIPAENRLEKRIDFQIRPKFTDAWYPTVLKSVGMYWNHTSYWTSEDLAAFVVNQLLRSSNRCLPSGEQPQHSYLPQKEVRVKMSIVFRLSSPFLPRPMKKLIFEMCRSKD